MTTKKPEPPILDQLRDVAQRIEAQHVAARKVREGTRVALAALETPEAKEKLTPRYLAQRRAELLAADRAAIDDANRQAVALAQAAIARRDSITGIDAAMRAARFCELLPLENDGSDFYDTNKFRTSVNEQRLLREELMRTRLRAELLDAEPGELADAVHEAASTNNLALLSICRSVLAKRSKTEDADSLTSAKVALISALQAIERPAEAQTAEKIFERIGRSAEQLIDLIQETDSGFQGERDLTARVERVRELANEFGPVAGPVKYAEERRDQKAQLAKQAVKQADREVRSAIIADATDAGANNPAA